MRIWHLSTFPPTPCGIGTYTDALIGSLADHENLVARMVYHSDETNPAAAAEVRVECRSDYERLAGVVNASDADVVSLQHEFAIYGGVDGEFVFDFLNSLRKPLVTTLHTTPKLISGNQARIIKALTERSDAVVVLSEAAARNVKATIGGASLSLIRHGVPEVDFVDPRSTTLRQELDRSRVLLSAGHMSDRKGYTNTIDAISRLVQEHEDLLYIILGTHQPQFGNNSQCLYSLKELVTLHRLDDHVLFVDEYLTTDRLIEYICACDSGIVAYTDTQQCSSGMIPLFLGCGRQVVATPFEYARETAAIVPGVLLCDGYQAGDITVALRAVLDSLTADAQSLAAIHATTRAWTWRHAAQQYTSVFGTAAANQLAMQKSDRLGSIVG